MAKPKSEKKPQLRIIGGEWRSRILTTIDAEGMRPTGNRTRETLFNWLAFELDGASCLDLFGGTGALGLEALSRGAKHCTFVENNPRAFENLCSNVGALDKGRSRSTVLSANAVSVLKAENKMDTTFSIVFVDPPFDNNLWQAVVDSLHANSSHALQDSALIYIESPKQATFYVPANWQLEKQKAFGSNQAQLYRFLGQEAT